MNGGKEGKPQLTVLTVTWNGWSDTQRCLRSVYATGIPDIEVVVFDNASLDGTPDKIANEFPEARVIRNPQNIGHTRGINHLMTCARGEFVLIIDFDTEFIGNAVVDMIHFLKGRPEVGLVAPRTLNSDGSVQESARRFPRPINGIFGRQSLLTRLFPGNTISKRYLQSDRLAENEPYEVEQISGACMLFRRSLFDETGPWDEGYFAYWVDSDWCFKVHKAGWKVYCLPLARMIHHEQNHRGKRKSLRRIWIFHYGAYRFYRNNMTWGLFDPRALAAAVALSVHGFFQFAHNALLSPPKPKALSKTE